MPEFKPQAPIYKSGLTKLQYLILVPCCLVPVLALGVWLAFLGYNKLARGKQA